MQNKAPQGKQDPIPTPESELEQYGVWVKAEPQDVVDETVPSTSATMTKAKDPEEPIPLSEPEELIDSFEFDEKMTDGIEELEALSPIDDIEIIGELPDEIEAFDLEALEKVDLEPLPQPMSENFVEDISEDAVLDISLDELDYEEPMEESEPRSLEPEPVQDDTFNTIDIDIEDFGLSDADSTLPVPLQDDFSNLESPSKTQDETLQQENTPSDDFEALDIDLQFDDTIPAYESVESSEAYTSADNGSTDVASEFESVDLDSIGLESASNNATLPPPSPAAPDAESETIESLNISMDSFIDLEDNDAPGIIPDMELENVSLNDESVGFDDVQAVSDDLGAVVPGPSSDLLQKIVLELSSIKEELVSLRGQLSNLKTANQTIPILEKEEEMSEEGAPGGFFDEEDDDTIALTGDELDNILNTADFTEEVADNESVDERSTVSLEIPDEMELLPEDGVYETQESGIETIELPTITPTEAEFDSISAEEGVTPVTNLSEDTSFLDDSDDEMNLEFEMPLIDVPLVEPDSSDLDSIIDSAFDTGDAAFNNLEVQGEELETEIVLDFDSDDEPVISTVDSFPEPLDEIEDALELEEFVESEELGGLELLAEESELEELEELSLDDEPPSSSIEVSEDVDTASEELETLSSPTDSDESPSIQPSELFAETPPSDNDFEAMESYLEPETIIPDEHSSEIAAETEAEDTSTNTEAAPLIESAPTDSDKQVPDKLKHDVKSVLLYLDQLLASLPEEKIEEFASSEYYDTYKRLFDDLGLL